MMKGKKFLALLLSIIMVLSMLPLSAMAAGNTPFTDVKTTDWFYDSVEYVYENGIMSGTSNTTFSPYNTTTRGMIVTILWGLEGKPAVSATQFDDVADGQYYADAVKWAAANSVVSGYGNGKFGPDDTITREQFAVIVYRYAGLKGYDVTEKADLSAFTDQGEISSYAVDALAWANAAGLINGVSSTVISPSGNATRAQAAAIFTRLHKTVMSSPDHSIGHTVIFDLNYSNAGVYQTVNIESGEKVSAPTNPSRSGYTFGGWYTSASGGNKFDFNTAIEEDTILYAKWNAVSSGGGGGGSSTPNSVKYTLSFADAENGTINVSVAGSYTAGESITLTATPADGYAFAEWTSDNGGVFAKADDSSTTFTMPSHDVVITALFSAVDATQTCVVTFDMNDTDGGVYQTVTVKSGETVSVPSDPTREGYTFGGWYTAAADGSLFDFDTAIVENITVYAKWNAISDAEAYFKENSQLIQVLSVEESTDVPTESEVKSFFEEKGFADYEITYEYSITGDIVDEASISDNSADKHPMYQTFYLSENGDGWAIYDINGKIFANPASFNLESDLGAPLLVSESETLTSYDYESNCYYETIPYASAVIVETIDEINAKTLDTLTIEKLYELSGATVPISEEPDEDGEDKNTEENIAVLSLDDFESSTPVAAIAEQSVDDPIIVVSLGDSYSSGEGIEPFYGQNDADGREKPAGLKVQDEDWLAHRSTKSWPGLLKIPDVSGTMKDYRVSNGSYGSGNVQWYFGAVSGAKTEHFSKEQQVKSFYQKTAGRVFSGSKTLPYQLDIFKNIPNGTVDYVTLTIGGNDVDFSGVITKCVIESSYLESGHRGTGLERKLDALWRNIDKTMADIRQVYQDISEKAGAQAAILVAGYPKLLDKDGKGFAISKQEATEVNENVTAFNNKIKELVAQCRLSNMNIYFVDVETEFDKDGGHQAYSDDAWINKIYLGTKSQDINGKSIASDYSMHPNEQGAEAYARCVNETIKEIEAYKKTHKTISGKITIADADTDMTNNAPLFRAQVTIDSSSSTIATTLTGATGDYKLGDIPTGTYTITVSKDGYIPAIENITVSEADTEIIYNITIESIPENYRGSGYACGQIVDVRTGQAITGLTLYIREGLENTSGNVVDTIHMDSSATYMTSALPAGNYTIQAVDERTGITDIDRYTTTSFNIKILGQQTINNQNGYVSNGIEYGELRVVLTWGATPSDLDSHLVGPTSNGNKFHVYFGNKTYGSETDLDVDNTTGYGPETITIRSFNDGVYTYAVHNFSNQRSSYSTALANSGAQVKLYSGDVLIATYNVPTNKDGTLWTVFTYDSNTQSITTVNTMSYDSSSGGSLMTTALLDDVETSESSEYEEVIAILMQDIYTSIKQ